MLSRIRRRLARLGCEVLLAPRFVDLVSERAGRPAALDRISTRARLTDFLDRRFVATWQELLAWQAEERERISIDPSCVDPDRRHEVENAYRTRTSHRGPPGASRILEGAMIWETVWPLLHLDLSPGMRIADVGAENSCLAPWFASRGLESHAIDAGLGRYGESFRTRVLEPCRDRTLVLEIARAGREPGIARYHCQDASRLAFGSETFDRIVCLSVLEHIPDETAVVREMSRVLRPGGRLAITVPVGRRHRQGSDLPHRRGPDGRWTGDLDRVYSPETLQERIVGPAGLEVLGDLSRDLSAWSGLEEVGWGLIATEGSAALVLRKGDPESPPTGEGS